MICLDGTDVNDLSSSGLSPLHLAAFAENKKAVKTLLKRGANINVMNLAKKGHHCLVQYSKITLK